MTARPDPFDVAKARRVIEIAECDTAGHPPNTAITTTERATPLYHICRCGRVRWIPEETSS